MDPRSTARAITANKNHVNVDRRHKLVRRYQVTDAAVHDSQVVEDILDADNTASVAHPVPWTQICLTRRA